MRDSTHPRVYRSALVAFAWSSGLQKRSKISVAILIHRSRVVGLSRCPPWPSTVSDRGLRGSPHGSFPSPKRRDAALVTFASRSARSHISRSTSQRRSAVLLPLLGFVSPLRRTAGCASTPSHPPDDSRRLRCDLRADGATRRLLFRPRGFSPPRRLPPRSRSRACCISLPAMGFAAFSDFPCPIAPEGTRNTVAVLATLTPFEESPSPSAVPRHRGPCLLAVSARVRPASSDSSVRPDACVGAVESPLGARPLEERWCRRDPARAGARKTGACTSLMIPSMKLRSAGEPVDPHVIVFKPRVRCDPKGASGR